MLIAAAQPIASRGLISEHQSARPVVHT